MHCKETEISSFVNSFDDMQALFKKSSPEVQTLFANAMFTTDYCRRIEALKMTVNETRTILRTDNTIISSDKLESKIARGVRPFERLVKRGKRLYNDFMGKDRLKLGVEVAMLHTSWIFRDRKTGERKSFRYFIKALLEADSELMYTTDFMIMIVDEFWSLY